MLQTYTILTIGDGLVSQIPALIISTATGIMITRASNDEGNFAEGSIKQLMGNAKVMIIVGVIMMMFALTPGLPTISMGFVGLVFLGLGYALHKYEKGDFVLTSAPAMLKVVQQLREAPQPLMVHPLQPLVEKVMKRLPKTKKPRSKIS